MRWLKLGVFLPTLLVVLVASGALAQTGRVEIAAWGSFVDMTGKTNVDEASGVDIDFRNGAGFGLAGAYRVADRISVELGAAFLRSSGAIRLNGQDVIGLGSLDMVPITALVRFHPLRGPVDPWLGVGGAYVVFQNLQSRDLDIAGTGVVRVKDKLAFVADLGVAFDIVPHLQAMLDARYMALKPSSERAAGGTSQDLKLNPLVISAGLRLAF